MGKSRKVVVVLEKSELAEAVVFADQELLFSKSMISGPDGDAGG